MRAKEFMQRMPSVNEVLEDDPHHWDLEFTEKEMYAFAEAYAEYRIKLLNEKK